MPTEQAVLVRGFGLVELMVSVSIMVLVSGIILSRHSAFNAAVLLRNQSYELAFALRQAQLLAVSGTGNTQQYGLYVTNSTGAGANQEYIIFQDVDGSGLWDAGDTQIEKGRLDARFKIKEARYNGTPGTTRPDMSITFKRPNFDAILHSSADGATVLPGPVNIEIGQINDASGVGTVRQVEVTNAGRISVP